MTFTILFAAVIGGATAMLDLFAIVLQRIVGGPPVDAVAMIGRWIGHFPDGRFVHDKIAIAAPVRGERALGWLAHYAVGVRILRP